MFRNMARSLVIHERIRTTEAKAKELRKVADNLVTLALRNDLHARRQAFKVLENHGLVKKLFDEIGPRFAGVPGGFTRVVKLGLPRRGDSADLAVIEFSRQPGEEQQEKPKKTKKKAEPAPEQATAAEAAPEQTQAEEAVEPAPEAEEPTAEVAEEAPAEAEETPEEAPEEPTGEAEEPKEEK
jgi:large subunit ribosomal protein L17